MIGQELRESVLKWASQQKEPFITADVFENIEEAETLKEASDSLRKLFLSGHLARKKMDNVRYVYIVSAMAPPDFERCFPDDDQNLSGSEQVVKIAPNITKRYKKPSENGTSGSKSMQETMTEKPINARKMADDAPRNVVQATKESEVKTFSLPESFTLTLQTPGGLIITIASGANNGLAQ